MISLICAVFKNCTNEAWGWRGGGVKWEKGVIRYKLTL